MARGTPRRPRSWLEDFPRRVRLEAAARAAYPGLRYRRRQRASGPVDIYQYVQAVPGYEDRRVTVEFDRRAWWAPRIYVDGPSGVDASPHRYADRGRTRLCVWHPGDPDDRTWVPEDGLLVLFGMIAEHLFKEAWWREHGEWLGEEYPHDELTKDHAPHRPQPARPTMIQAPAPTTTTIAPPAFPASTTASVAVPTTTPLPGAAPGASSAGLIGAIISGAFLAAMLAGAVNVWMARRRSREEERARIRNTFAAAFEAYTAYKEFPYAIRRRRLDDPEAERIRLSEALRAVQERLSYYLAWTQAEAVEVGQQYARLIAEARRVAGQAMHDAWNDPPRATDPEMNIPQTWSTSVSSRLPRPSTCRPYGSTCPA